MLVVSDSRRTDVRAASDALRAIAPSDAEILSTDGEVPLAVAAWGEQPQELLGSGVAALVRQPITPDFRPFGREQIASLLLSDGPPSINDLLPPFAAAALGDDGRLVAATDHLGLRQLFYAVESGRVAVSTSSSALARWLGKGINHDALAIQSLLGWQLGDRTLFEGVRRVPAGATVRVHGGRLELDAAVTPADRDAGSGSHVPHPDPAGAVDEAVELLTDTIAACLEATPDVVFQLSGGIDTRVLLAAIPPGMRRGLRAMTLGARGDADVDTAVDLAQRCGLDHRLLPLANMESWDPDDAFAAAAASARRLDYAADPLALTAVRVSEGDLVDQPRIAGIGGEHARGYYRAGPTLPVSTSRRAVVLIARYRLFTNEAVLREVLEPEFASWARRFTEDEVTNLAASYDDHLYEALDEFYLRQRVERSTGVAVTAVAFDRVATYPLLDERFVRLVRRLPPNQKSADRFMARLVATMDAELAAIPLDGRASPAVLASRGVADRARQLRFTGTKVVRKVDQRFRGTRRARKGGATLVGPMTEFLRRSPARLEEVGQLGIFRASWLEQCAHGTATPDAPTLAFLTNILAALEHGQVPARPR